MQTILIDKQTDWGGDFKLHIQKKEVNDDCFIYTICSMDNEVPVGFELQVPMQIDIFGNGIVFKSLGEMSDNFLKTLYSIYNLNLQDNLYFVKSISCKYAGLNDLTYKGNGQKRLSHINYIKVLLEGSEEEESAELYINIDESTNTIEFEEKAYEYRPYVALLLTAE